MNPPDPILDSLLAAVRQTKHRRQARRIALATAACVLAAAASLMTPRPGAAPLSAAPAEPPPAPELAPASTLAMLVWQDGVPRLEELPAEDLGLVELQFGLEPVIAYPDAFWRDPWN